ncbi:hypothetical protein BDF20DRAFT_902407 [Mycotypha africana]|uniref:uncharacterized protein n=1 Tax=Mycotypha africana TaxID=64632 RepID=UPI00230094A1|nr:uncharacterized protein BDF20DRAFT_902407 [Mycotypha africana]KAI8967070.1 hypothetical protein BDF20DRAFT_902407 [Mycotypha africana]
MTKLALSIVCLFSRPFSTADEDMDNVQGGGEEEKGVGGGVRLLGLYQNSNRRLVYNTCFFMTWIFILVHTILKCINRNKNILGSVFSLF